MDFNKKRKIDENGDPTSPDAAAAGGGAGAAPVFNLTPDDIRKIIEPFTKEQLLDILQTAAVHHADVLDSIRSVADSDVTLRKLFIRGLAAETTSDTLRALFAAYGELDEGIVIMDKNTGKSKGYGFITFKHIDGARMALKDPSKKIDGRMTVTQLASAGLSSSGGNIDISLRKIYVGNVPYDIPSEKLLSFFSMYGEIEEGPLGFDKSSGKPKGFAFIIYKTEEGARAAITEPMKNINGHQVICKLAADNKKGNRNNQGPTGFGGDSGQMQQQQVPQPQPSMPGYGGPANLQPYGYGLNSSMPGAVSGAGGYGGGYGVSQYGGPGSGEYGGMNTAGNAMYRPPPSSVGMVPGGYPDAGPYGMPQQHQPASLPARAPPGGMYPGVPPYYN